MDGSRGARCLSWRKRFGGIGDSAYYFHHIEIKNCWTCRIVTLCPRLWTAVVCVASEARRDINKARGYVEPFLVDLGVST